MENVRISSKFFSNDCENETIEEECKKLSEEITNRNISVLAVVEDLGSLLTSKSHECRQRGTWILSETLACLPNDFLTEAELEFVVKFYADRIKDHHFVIPAVFKGILTLTKIKNLPDGSATILLSALFHHIACQQHARSDRHRLYLILAGFLERNPEEIKKMGSEYVFGVISAVDGERDPRNLLYLFNWLPVFFKNVSLGHLTEDAFDIIGCYFPIDFRSSMEETDGITRSELSVTLNPCLYAVPEFGEFCLPLLLEKLDSSLQIAKLDSLILLAKSCQTFPVINYTEHLTQIWTLIQQNVITNANEEIVNAALNALESVLTLVSNTQTENSLVFTEILNEITRSMKTFLVANSKAFSPANKILLTVAKVSPESCGAVIKNCIPTLINQYYLIENIEEQAAILENLIGYAVVYKKHHGTLKDCNELSNVPLQCVSALSHKDQSMKVTGLNGVHRLIECIEDRKEIYKIILSMVIDERDVVVRESLMSFLKNSSALYPTEVSDNIIMTSYFTSNDFETLNFFLDAMYNIVCVENFADVIISNCSRNCFSDNDNIRKAMMHCYYKIVTNYYQDNKIQKYLNSNEYIDKIIHSYIEFSQKDIKVDDNFYEELLEILRNLVEVNDDQEKTISKHIPHILNIYGDISATQCSKRTSIILLEGLLTRAKRHIKIPQKENIFHNLLDAAFDSCDLIQNSAIRLISNMINKTGLDDDIESILNKIKSYISEFTDNSNSKKNIFIITSWITKALVMRNHPLMNQWIDIMISQLKLNRIASEGFGLVLEDDPLSLNMQSDCQISVLYKQKFFVICHQKLSTNIETNSDHQENLIAIAYLIKNSPQQVLTMNFSKVYTSLIRCLQIDDSDVLITILNKLDNMLKSKEVFFSKYVQDFIPVFLNLTKYKQSMNVRIGALSCLFHYTYYEHHLLLPYKKQVAYHLISCLDDTKRLVRRQAVETRCRWCMLETLDEK